MAEQEAGQIERKRGKGKILALFAALGAALAVFTFWRKRRSDEEEDEE